MRKLLMVAALTAASCFGVNFAYVQGVDAISSGGTNVTLTGSFGSNNTAGNAIMVVAYVAVGGGSGIAVSDTQGNTYTFQIVVIGAWTQEIWSADHIHAGANTVTVTGVVAMVAMEYSSVTSAYCIAPASFTQAGGGVSTAVGGTFATATEAMAVFEAYTSSANTPITFSLSAGNSRFVFNIPGGGLNTRGALAADQDVPSITSYSVSWTSNSAISSSAAAFLYLGSCGGGGSGGGGSAAGTFPIIY